jgi:hypothetical protein
LTEIIEEMGSYDDGVFLFGIERIGIHKSLLDAASNQPFIMLRIGIR